MQQTQSSDPQINYTRKSNKKISHFYKDSQLQQHYERDASQLQVIKDDGYLEPFKQHFEIRNGRFFELLDNIIQKEESLIDFAKGYEQYCLVANELGITYKEWAPEAKEVYLTGDFNQWDRKSHKCTRDAFGNWELFLPMKADGTQVIAHNSRVKTHILDANNQWADKIPAWITYTRQNENTKVLQFCMNQLFDGVFWNPAEKYRFQNERPLRPHNLKIYEVHVGMAGVEPRVHSYKEFTQNVLPRVVELGYNTIQIMAIQEHAYYGSFGYHVTNFFAASSRFGTPDDLKEMIDAAHGLGIFVLMDLVHSHASSNVCDGINKWDGSDFHYFHAGQKGNHDLWDSRLFDYGKWEVLRFLLSNLSWWMNEYKFDGFRFDGISSMLYTHHGIGTGFGGGYHEYFSEQTDLDSISYLMLANDLVHQIYPEAITIAEDVSGYVHCILIVKAIAMQNDQRWMAMAVPDNWIKMVKEQKDEDWSMSEMVHTLTNRREKEKCVCYTECHDQALVGDKTLAMWLFDKQIYDNMSTDQPESLVVTRGMALHKMIRLITIALGGEGYLTFMGNEFGHPEWIDFPREGNNWSYHYARRRWDIADNQSLRYNQLLKFDVSMIQLEEKYQWLQNQDQYVTLKHDGDKIVVFERGPLLFVFNFHPDRSFEHYRIGTRFPHDHQLVLDTDQAQFGGHSRVRDSYNQLFPIQKETWCDRPNYIQIYIPNRCAMVFAPQA